MKENWKAALDHVLRSEGGFVSHPSDPGGATNLGCTKAVWEEFCGHPVEVDAIKALTPADVEPLYQSKYWDRIKGDELPNGIDYCVFDASINSGVGRASKWLQECAGVQPDGVIGPMTLRVAQAIVPADLVNMYCDKRLRFLKELKTWDTFGKGWERRVEEVRSHALKLLSV
jgi:lysozyme family protein